MNPSSIPAPRPAHGRILCVDDDADDRAVLKRLIEDCMPGVTCELLPSGDAMLEALLRVLKGATPPLACFVDVKMAGMSGFDVLRWIRCQKALDTIPVIMLSSSDDPEKISEAGSIGAQCYTAKFPPVAELRKILQEAQRFSVAHSFEQPFELPCNLMLGTHAAKP